MAVLHLLGLESPNPKACQGSSGAILMCGLTSHAQEQDTGICCDRLMASSKPGLQVSPSAPPPSCPTHKSSLLPSSPSGPLCSSPSSALSGTLQSLLLLPGLSSVTITCSQSLEGQTAKYFGSPKEVPSRSWSHLKAGSSLQVMLKRVPPRWLLPFTRRIAQAELCLRGLRTDCTGAPSLTVGYLGPCREVGLWLTHLCHLMSSTWS